MSMVKVMKIDEWLEKKSIEKDAIIFKDQHWTFSHLNKLITKTSLFLQINAFANSKQYAHKYHIRLLRLAPISHLEVVLDTKI